MKHYCELGQKRASEPSMYESSEHQNKLKSLSLYIVNSRTSTPTHFAAALLSTVPGFNLLLRLTARHSWWPLSSFLVRRASHDKAHPQPPADIHQAPPSSTQTRSHTHASASLPLVPQMPLWSQPDSVADSSDKTSGH